MNKLSIIFFAMLCMFSLNTGARLPRAATELPEKIRLSEMVLVVEAVYPVEDSTQHNIVRTRVLKIIKGKPHSKYILFVTNNFSAEGSSRCCETGGTYLVFLNRGYTEMIEDQRGFVVVSKETDKYVSGADRSFSAYKIVHNKVQGWPSGGNNETNLKQVIKEIKAQIRTQKRNSL